MSATDVAGEGLVGVHAEREVLAFVLGRDGHNLGEVKRVNRDGLATVVQVSDGGKNKAILRTQC